jgi:hypothetical protein
VSKDKKKKKKDKKKDKGNGSLGTVAKAAGGLKSIADNPLVADIVAAALVGAAAALKDSNKARQLAADAGDQLDEMAKGSADKGSAMWQLALEVGRRTLDTLAGETQSNGRKAK